MVARVFNLGPSPGLVEQWAFVFALPAQKTHLVRGATQLAYRYPWFWPFDASSYINIGIGSNAAYSQPGEGPHNNFQGNAGGPGCNGPGGYPGGAGQWNCPTFVGTASDPLTYIPPGSNIWWDGVNQPASSIHLPASATYAAYGDTSGNMDYLMAAFDQTKPRDYWLFNNATSFSGRSPGSVSGGTFNGTFYPGGQVSGGFQSYWDCAGNGIAQWGQGNTIPVLNGNDLDLGYCNRMLPCSIWPQLICWWDQNAPDFGWGTSHWPSNRYNCVWPCKGSDSNLNGYVGGPGNPGGCATGIPFGSVIFIPKAVASAAQLGISSKGGLLCFNQLQNYGWLVSNRAGSFVTYSSDDVTSTAARSQTFNEYTSTLSGLLPYMRILKSWMYGLSYQQQPNLPLPPGFQFDPSSSNSAYYGTGMGFNTNAPINGGGTYPAAPPQFDPALGIGTGGGTAPSPSPPPPPPPPPAPTFTNAQQMLIPKTAYAMTLTGLDCSTDTGSAGFDLLVNGTAVPSFSGLNAQTTNSSTTGSVVVPAGASVALNIKGYGTVAPNTISVALTTKRN